MLRPCLCPRLCPCRVGFPAHVPDCPPWKTEAPSHHQQASRSTRALSEQQLSIWGDPLFFPLSQDLDDMDADLLGLRKSHLASSKSAAKGSGRQEPPSNPKPAGTFTANEKGEWDLALWNLGGFGDAEM